MRLLTAILILSYAFVGATAQSEFLFAKQKPAAEYPNSAKELDEMSASVLGCDRFGFDGL